MASVSAKRLHWSLVASVAAHAVLAVSLPSVRLSVSNAAVAKPMRVVRAYHAAVIPPQLVSAPVRALEARTADVVSPARRKPAPPTRSTPKRSPRPKAEQVPAKRPAPAPPSPAPRATAKPSPGGGGSPAPAPGPSAAIRCGPPERLALGPPLPRQVAVGSFILSEPAPLPGQSEGAGSAIGEAAGSGSGGSGTGSGGGSGGGGPTVSPSAVSLAKPAYPEECRRRNQEGTVGLRVLVLREGSVGRAEVARSSGIKAFDSAAREGARNWRFRPARRGDTPIEAWVALSVVFRLEDAHR